MAGLRRWKLKRLQISLLKVLIVVCYTICTVQGEGCDTVYSGVKTWGSCENQCFCKDDVQCEETTGECPMILCALDQFNPSCQYTNIAQRRIDYHQYGPQPWNQHRAVDESETTYSGSSARSGLHYFQIDFDNNYYIYGVYITTHYDQKEKWRRFRIELSENSADGFQLLCYEHPDEVFPQNMMLKTHPNSQSFIFNCLKPIQARHIRIILTVDSQTIKFGDLRIFSDLRFISFNKQTLQPAASVTVDGKSVTEATYNSLKATTCLTLQDTAMSSFVLDLGAVYDIKRVTLNGWETVATDVLYFAFGNESDSVVTSGTYGGFANQVKTFDAIVSAVGQYVEIGLANSTSQQVVCEVTVEGNCLPDRCGLNCSIVCMCMDWPLIHPDVRVTGLCPGQECYPGWMVSEAGYCDTLQDCSGSDKYPGVPAYGPVCEKRCYCRNDEQCLAKSGKCLDQCAPGWMGNSCQYRNLMSSYLEVEIQGPSGNAANSSCAVDGDLKTCCVSDTSAYPGQQYLYVKLKEAYQVHRMVLHVPKHARAYFKKFQVLNAATGDVLFTHKDENVTMPFEFFVHVLYPVTIQELRLQLATPGTPLELCEWQIDGGFELAFMRPSDKSSAAPGQHSYHAIDGDLNSLSCFSSVSGDSSPWWSVDLGKQYKVSAIYLHRTSDVSTSFTIKMKGNYGGYLDVYTFYPGFDVGGPRHEIQFSSPQTSQYVRIEQQAGVLTLCDVQVFGDCTDGLYGPDCDQECGFCQQGHCRPSNGDCPLDCSAPYAPPPKCQNTCEFGRYGLNCEGHCGHCQVAGFCMMNDGHCAGGCEAGWLPPLCVQNCTTVYAGVPTFGPDCSYRCHCAGDVACNSDTGECPAACAQGWIGYACQYRNVAASLSSVAMQGSALPGFPESNAVDGNLTTCAYSDVAAYAGQHYFIINLHTSYRVARVILHIPGDVLGNYEEFVVLYPSTDSGPYDSTCYNSSGKVIAGVMDVECESPALTSSLKVMLSNASLQLGLCELQIYGGRDLSFNRNPSQSSIDDTWYPHYAIDGRHLEPGEDENTTVRTCFRSLKSAEPSLTIDLSQDFLVEGVLFYGRNSVLEEMAGFVVSLKKEDGTEFLGVATDIAANLTDYQPRHTPVTSPALAKYVRVSRPSEAPYYGWMSVCELQVLGDCPPDRCGLNCTLDCYCVKPHLASSDKIQALCPDGCRDRYTGHNNTCVHACDVHSWGPDCNIPCGNCHKEPCLAANGHCEFNCSGTWQPPDCVNECTDGTYGLNCAFGCGNCKIGTVCNKATGHCPNGCEPGWLEPLCIEHVPDCSTVYAGVPTFGPDCSYRCHCAGDVACNSDTGECPAACASGWIGYACQYRDIQDKIVAAYLIGSSASPSTNMYDADPTTCASTDPNNNDGQQYIRLLLFQPYRIRGIVFTVPAGDLGKFAKFRVEMGNPWENFPLFCYEHPDEPLTGATAEVACLDYVLSEHLRIILHQPNVPLTLCDIHILLDREVAFNKPTSQSTMEGLSGDFYSYKMADGEPYRSPDASDLSCFSNSFAREVTPWVSLDLRAQMELHELHLYASDQGIETIQRFRASIGKWLNQTAEVYMDVPPASDQVEDYRPLILPINNLLGQVLKIENEFYVEDPGLLRLCEIRMFGDCPVDRCGWNCSIDCFCRDRLVPSEHLMQGTCPQGCRERYTGLTLDVCNHKCSETQWGYMCNETCGHCLAEPCDFFTAVCPQGCDGAWQLPDCTKVCENGTFGVNCSIDCGHCSNNAVCDRVNGSCPQGCEVGWFEPQCIIECGNRTYGGLCTPCGECLDNLVCDNVTGVCPLGCYLGYQPPNCHGLCDHNTYGLQCVEQCGDCFGNETCDPMTGLCPSGLCDPGYLGLDCQTECPNATYGLNCTLSCGHCGGPPECNVATGICPWGCDPGFGGSRCFEVVDPPLTFMTGMAVGILATTVFLVATGLGLFKFYNKQRERFFLVPQKQIQVQSPCTTKLPNKEQ